MAPDSVVSAGATAERDVMAAVDDDRFIIADIARDEAWLGMPAKNAITLSEFC